MSTTTAAPAPATGTADPELVESLLGMPLDELEGHLATAEAAYAEHVATIARLEKELARSRSYVEGSANMFATVREAVETLRARQAADLAARQAEADAAVRDAAARGEWVAASRVVFETGTCGRCGGSGRYSYNMMDGDRCYGCSGTGITETRAGAAAHKRYTAKVRELGSVTYGEVKVGDRIGQPGTIYGSKFRRVLEVGPAGSASIIDGERVSHVGVKLEGLEGTFCSTPAGTIGIRPLTPAEALEAWQEVARLKGATLAAAKVTA